MKKSNIVLALVSVGLMTLSASMYAQNKERFPPYSGGNQAIAKQSTHTSSTTGSTHKVTKGTIEKR